MMMRLSMSSLAGTARTLVAVGSSSDCSMLATMLRGDALERLGLGAGGGRRSGRTPALQRPAGTAGAGAWAGVEAGAGLGGVGAAVAVGVGAGAVTWACTAGAAGWFTVGAPAWAGAVGAAAPLVAALVVAAPLLAAVADVGADGL